MVSDEPPALTCRRVQLAFRAAQQAPARLVQRTIMRTKTALFESVATDRRFFETDAVPAFSAPIAITACRWILAIDLQDLPRRIHIDRRPTRGTGDVPPRGEDQNTMEGSRLSTLQSELVWRKSQRCDSNSCVEVAQLGEEIALRDSKRPDGPVLVISRGEWDAFVAGVGDGDFQF
jgi:hypothetical protein